MSTGGARPSGGVNTICPDVMAALRGRIRIIACAVIDLPDPDSPTSASVAPGAMAKETRSSARTFMPRLSNSIDRSRTSTRFVL